MHNTYLTIAACSVLAPQKPNFLTNCCQIIANIHTGTINADGLSRSKVLSTVLRSHQMVQLGNLPVMVQTHVHSKLPPEQTLFCVAMC